MQGLFFQFRIVQDSTFPFLNSIESILSFFSNEILKMKLLLFALLSISNGNYESGGLHDVGTVESGVDGVHDAGITLERRSLRLYLKPYTLNLVNSRARDDRIGSKIIPWSMNHQRTYGP